MHWVRGSESPQAGTARAVAAGCFGLRRGGDGGGTDRARRGQKCARWAWGRISQKQANESLSSHGSFERSAAASAYDCGRCQSRRSMDGSRRSCLFRCDGRAGRPRRTLRKLQRDALEHSSLAAQPPKGQASRERRVGSTRAASHARRRGVHRLGRRAARFPKRGQAHEGCLTCRCTA